MPVALLATAGALTSCADAQRVTSVMHRKRTPETLNVGRVKVHRSPGTVEITFTMYKVDDDASLFVKQLNREPVIFEADSPRVIGRAVMWAQVLQDARHRLAFVKEDLAYNPSTEAAMAYLRGAQGRYVPRVGGVAPTEPVPPPHT